MKLRLFKYKCLSFPTTRRSHMIARQGLSERLYCDANDNASITVKTHVGIVPPHEAPLTHNQNCFVISSWFLQWLPFFLPLKIPYRSIFMCNKTIKLFARHNQYKCGRKKGILIVFQVVLSLSIVSLNI